MFRFVKNVLMLMNIYQWKVSFNWIINISRVKCFFLNMTTLFHLNISFNLLFALILMNVFRNLMRNWICIVLTLKKYPNKLRKNWAKCFFNILSLYIGPSGSVGFELGTLQFKWKSFCWLVVLVKQVNFRTFGSCLCVLYSVNL